MNGKGDKRRPGEGYQDAWDRIFGRKPSECQCHQCTPISVSNMRMILCPICGNKRCPKANDHRNDCTGSNETGQTGSYYAEQAPVNPVEKENK